MTTATNTKGFTKATTCRRCAGTGMVGGPVVYAGIPGACFKCDGTGQVEGDNATIAAKKARNEGRKALGQAALDFSADAHWGLGLLEVNEPARVEAAIASFLAGRADVLPALAAYGKAGK